MNFLNDAFLKVFIDTKKFVKNEVHKECCYKVFLPHDAERKQEFEQVFMTHKDHQTLCSCTCLDLVLQTNHMLDSPTMNLEYEFFFKTFQCY